MNIVLPILFAAAVLGLTLRRMTPLAWVGLTVWIALVMAYQFFKH